MRALIIGGGIGGLTAAIALRKVGIDAQIYERAPALREVGAGIGIVANALRALDALGLGDAIRSSGLTGVQGGLRNPEGETLVAIPADELTRQLGTVAVLHRAELLYALAQQIEPERLHLGRQCTGFEQDSEGVTLRFQNGETADADVLIGADGLKSTVRMRMFGDRPVRYAGYTAWRAVVDFDRAHKLIMGETWGRGRRFGIIPMSAGRVYWFATSNAAEGGRDRDVKIRQALLQLFRGWHEPVEALITAASENSILRNDIYDIDPLASCVQGRVSLLGDAAHPMTPNLGQGACQAIEDAVVLAACLKTHSTVAAALLEYDRRRMSRTRLFVLRSRWLGAVAQLENPNLCSMRDAAVHATPQSIAARQMKSLLGVDILTPAEKMLFE